MSSLAAFFPDLLEFILAALCLAVHLLVFLRFRSPDRRWLPVALGLSAAFVAFGTVFPVQTLRRFGLFDFLAWARGLGLLWGACSAVSLTLVLLSGVLDRRVSGRRRQFLRTAGVAVATAPVLACGYGILRERFSFRTREIDIAVPGLAKDLQGLRIVQLSDIHLSPYLDERSLARVVDMANEARANLAVVTGDMITGIHDPLEVCLDQLARLKADAGVYGCMGNHEVVARALGRAKRLGEQRGLHFLRWENASLRFGEAELNLVGVDYQSFSSPYLVGAERMVKPGSMNVLLSHNPDVFPVAAEQGYQLTLSGHTHGGQVTVEILNSWINAARMFTPYVYGRYQKEGSSIYVTRGIGTIGVPARVAAPPEIAIIRLCAS